MGTWTRGTLGCCLAFALVGGCDTYVPGRTDVSPGADAGAEEPPKAPDADLSCGEMTYSLSETQDELVIPDNVRFLHVKAWGAGGNGEGLCSGPGEPDTEGGIGGYSEAVFAVQPGDVLSIIVGKRGRSGYDNDDDRRRFGFGSWGGGGLSGVFTGSEPVTENDSDRALVIAGGGGSAGLATCMPGGTGNHLSGGGEPTMLGSLGDDGINGGGGGYRGGSGGAGANPGKGGLGFVHDSAINERQLYSEPGTNEPPAADEPGYDGAAGKTEASGLVYLSFGCSEPDVPVD